MKIIYFSWLLALSCVGCFQIAGADKLTGRGMVAVWDFDGTEGGVAKDSSGHGHDGKLRGAVPSSGKTGRGLECGQNALVEVPYTAALDDFKEGITIAAWVNRATDTSWNTIMSREVKDGPSEYFGLAVVNNKALFSVDPDGAHYQNIKSEEDVPTGQWIHLAGAFDNAVYRLYVNGRLVKSAACSVPFKFADHNPLLIGGNSNSQGKSWVDCFHGVLDEVKLYNRALTVAEVLQMVSRPSDSSPDIAEKVFPGADEKTPSRAHYFSWINNAWEGSTAAQTLLNLDFFQWLRDEYGMQLGCYALDAGNIDSQNIYGSMDSLQFKRKFPEGFGPISAKARALNCQLGMWAGPDGFGNTPQDEQKRVDMMVSLCRDHDFALLKLDACASGLRPEKQNAFIRMMKECRQFRPDLIVLNHRIDFGKATPYATTFLFEGAETYIDVHMANEGTATHNRAGALSRKLVPGLKRLTEDHGVCLSSCLDFWEDDLILQAFNRSLILAPEIYGNPWFLRDDEFPKLARIYNLHRHYRDLLVSGIVLPETQYGSYAVSRGDGETRFVTLRNLTWQPVKYAVELGSSIGLSGSSEVEVRQFHPSERILGKFPTGSKVEVEVLPFRSCLVMASTKPVADLGVNGCDYEVVRDAPGKPVVLNLLGMPGDIATVSLALGSRSFKSAHLDGQSQSELLNGKSLQAAFPGAPRKNAWHRKLGELKPIGVPADAESLYESTCYAADNNALEVRSILRSGPTRVPEVQKARDAFFQTPWFAQKGIWDRNLFDGNMETRFDPAPNGELDRKEAGALRVDFGERIKINRLVLKGKEIQVATGAGISVTGEVSIDLKTWETVGITAERDEITASIPSAHPVRFFRLNCCPTPLAEVEGYQGTTVLDRDKWRASNLFRPYAKAPAIFAWSLACQIDEAPAGGYMAIALPGRHGVEGAYVALRVNDTLVGAPNRAVSYPANVWEAGTRRSDSNYTYYVPVTADMVGKHIEIIALVLRGGKNEIKPEAWLTAHPIPFAAKQLVLE